MADTSPFSLNVAGVQDLIQNPVNKVKDGQGLDPEGATGEKFDALDIDKSDEELLKLRDEYEKKYSPYGAKLKPRVAKIKESYLGKRASGAYLVDTEEPLAANLQFEAEETYLAAALAKNPEPVVWADNTPEGNAVASSVKTMLQFHADQLVLRRKLALMVRQHSMELLGVLKPGWNARIQDVAIDNRKIADYVFDPDGFVDAYGDFSSWYGERNKVTAEKLIELFPKAKEFISTSVEGKLGTEVTYTEWWPNDEFCFYTYKEKVLDKHKNQYFKYEEPEMDALGNPMIDETTGEPRMLKPRNHFAYPKKPAIFLSVYSLQEQPHDITSNTEQNIATQNKIFRRSEQIDYNVSRNNNSDVFSEDNFTQETAKQAANALRKGNPLIVPSGGPIDKAIMRLPAPQLPNDVFTELEIAKNDLRSSWGIQGIASQQPNEDQTARGMILNQAHDTTRIGGSIGDAIEQVADNTFNWLTQLYYVFYDEEHFAAIMGNAKAVEYVTLSTASLDRQLIVSVSPDSMKPKDEVTNINLAQALYDKGAIGPKILLKMVDFPDPDEAASDGALWQVDKMAYIRLNFPEMFQQLQQVQNQAMQEQMAMQAQGAGMTAAAEAQAVPPEATTEPSSQGGLAEDPASAALRQVPIPPL